MKMGIKILKEEDELRYKCKTYIHCFEMIKELFQFIPDYQIIAKKDFDERIEGYINLFRDMLNDP